MDMIGHRFTEYKPELSQEQANFENLLKIFLELLTHTSGDVAEALDWLNELDREYQLTDDQYGMADFIDELEREGYIARDGEQNNGMIFSPTAKSEQSIRSNALEEIFGKLRRGERGQHRTPYGGPGMDISSDTREYRYGDSLADISLTESLRNAQVRFGYDDFRLTDRDLEVREREYQTAMSTVLMIDISHSMILYGEDRITPAKKVAMALAELIKRRYPKDQLEIIVFGNEAWPIEVKDLPYLQVGPYHTNTVSGLELAMDLLRRKKTPNKQICMITDGKPTCLKEPDGSYYRNSFGLDRRIINKTLNLAHQARRLKVPISTFMIARDPYLQQFVHDFTEANNGRAFYSGIDKLGDFVLDDFERNRKKRL